MNLLKALTIFCVFSSIFLPQSNAAVITIENNSNEPLNNLKARILNPEELNHIESLYIRKAIVKLTNQSDEVLKKKLDLPQDNLDENTTESSNYKNNKTKAELDIPKNFHIKHIELICNDISYTFYLKDQMTKDLYKKNITFFFDYIVKNANNIKFRPHLLIL